MAEDNQLLGQDDIEALLSQTTSEKSPGESPAKPVKSAAIPHGADLLGQDDIDALLNTSHDKQGSDSDVEDFPRLGRAKSHKISDEEVLAMSVQLYNRGFLKRDPDVCVIWNALGSLPMNSGLGIKVQGIEYVTLGILHTKHLVVKRKE